jgi:WD40 repeat protein
MNKRIIKNFCCIVFALCSVYALNAQEIKLGFDFTRNIGFESVTYSPDGKEFVTSKYRGEHKELEAGITMWDAANGKMLWQYQGYIKSAQPFSFDGAKIIVIKNQGNLVSIKKTNCVISILDTKTGAELRKIEIAVEWLSDYINFVFSPDGKKIAFCSERRTGITILDVASEKRENYFDVFEPEKDPNSYHPDGAITLRAWDTPSIESIYYSNDGKRIIANYSKTIAVINAET